MTVAIVPACGRSSRMGRPKLMLPLGDRTVIERLVGCLFAGGVARVLVVAGPHVPELVPFAAQAGADVLVLPEPTADMRETVQRGLDRVEKLLHPHPDDWWLLAPADYPAMSADVVRQLLVSATNSPSCSAVVPVHRGRRGHPVLMRWRHAEGIRMLPAGAGIDVYLKGLAGETREVMTDDPGIVDDLDTPEDYRRIGFDLR